MDEPNKFDEFWSQSPSNIPIEQIVEKALEKEVILSYEINSPNSFHERLLEGLWKKSPNGFFYKLDGFVKVLYVEVNDGHVEIDRLLEEDSSVNVAHQVFDELSEPKSFSNLDVVPGIDDEYTLSYNSECLDSSFYCDFGGDVVLGQQFQCLFVEEGQTSNACNMFDEMPSPNEVLGMVIEGVDSANKSRPVVTERVQEFDTDMGVSAKLGGSNCKASNMLDQLGIKEAEEVVTDTHMVIDDMPRSEFISLIPIESQGIAGWSKECLLYCYYVLVFDPGTGLANPVETSPYLKVVGLHNVWDPYLEFMVVPGWCDHPNLCCAWCLIPRPEVRTEFYGAPKDITVVNIIESIALDLVLHVFAPDECHVIKHGPAHMANEFEFYDWKIQSRLYTNFKEVKSWDKPCIDSNFQLEWYTENGFIGYVILTFGPGVLFLLINQVVISHILRVLELQIVWKTHLGFHGFKACHVHGLYPAYFVWRRRVYGCCPTCLAGVRKLLCPHYHKKVSRQFLGLEGSLNGGTFSVCVLMWDFQLWIFTLEDKGDSSTEDVFLGTRKRMVIGEKMKSNLLLLPLELTHDPGGLDDKVFLVQKLQNGNMCRFSSLEGERHGNYSLLLCAGHMLAIQFVLPFSIDVRKEVGTSSVGYVFDPGGVCGYTILNVLSFHSPESCLAAHHSQVASSQEKVIISPSSQLVSVLSLQSTTLIFDPGGAELLVSIPHQVASISVQECRYSCLHCKLRYSIRISCVLRLLEVTSYSHTIFVYDPGGISLALNHGEMGMSIDWQPGRNVASTNPCCEHISVLILEDKDRFKGSVLIHTKKGIIVFLVYLIVFCHFLSLLA